MVKFDLQSAIAGFLLAVALMIGPAFAYRYGYQQCAKQCQTSK